MSISPGALRRLMREVATFRTSPPEGLRIVTSEEDMLDLTGIIAGPEGTPYEGGFFRVKFQFTEEFPAVPPKCTMLTKIFHPNVSKAGEICVNTLKKDWKREYGITHILVTVRCLLIYPNAESALDESSGKLLLENYNEYFKHAKLITSVHATPRTRPSEFDIPSAPQSSTTASGIPKSASSSRTPDSSIPSVATSSRTVSAAPSDERGAASKPPSKSSTGSGNLATVEPTEPLQLSPSNNSTVSKTAQIIIPSSSSSSSFSRGGTPMKENGPVTGSSPAGANGAVAGGPLQPAPSANGAGVKSPGGAVKRTAMVGGVAKRKKGLKRL